MAGTTIRAPRCPECGRPADPAHRPFCSARCRQVDLGRWLKGDYAIPGEPADPDDIAQSLAGRARREGARDGDGDGGDET